MTFVKVYRKSLQNELFLEIPYDRWHAFMFLLLEARKFPTVIVLKGKDIHLDTGQLIRGEDTLAEKWGWSKGKVRRYLSMLENLGMITKNGTPYGTLITIENYNKYQGEDITDGKPDGKPDGKADGKPDGKQRKKDKERERKKKNVFIPPTAEEVREYCEQRQNGIDPDEFVNFYQSKGWYIGKNKMKDWKAAVRTWERNRKGGRRSTSAAEQLDDFYKMTREWGKEENND